MVYRVMHNYSCVFELTRFFSPSSRCAAQTAQNHRQCRGTTEHYIIVSQCPSPRAKSGLNQPAAWQPRDRLTVGSLWGGTRYPATDLLLRFGKFIREIRKAGMFRALYSILFSEVRNARQFINMKSKRARSRIPTSPFLHRLK